MLEQFTLPFCLFLQELLSCFTRCLLFEHNSFINPDFFSFGVSDERVNLISDILSWLEVEMRLH